MSEINLEIINEQNIEELLNELKTLLGECNHAVYELIQHRNDEHSNHSANHLQEKLIHLKELINQSCETEEERKKHFLNHHAELMQHVNNHVFHMRHFIDHIIDEDYELEELGKIHEQAEHLQEKVEEKLHELKHVEHHDAHHMWPSLSPFAERSEE